MTILDIVTCKTCGCHDAVHTPDSTTPGVTWCTKCTGCCPQASNPEPVPQSSSEPLVLGSIDFGFGWAGRQLTRMIRKGLSWT